MTGLFPPGKGGGEEVAYGGKGKGILIHTLTEGNGMPLSNCTTPANGNEREQVLPLLDKVKLKTLKRGRPRKRLKVLAADKGYDSKQQRAFLSKRGIRPKTSLENKEKHSFDPSKSLLQDSSKSVVLLGINVNIVVWLFAGSDRKYILMHSLTLLLSISGFKESY